MEYFWFILLVCVAISCFLTKGWYERIMMFIYYALGLLFAVHIDGWGWKLLFVVIVGSILTAEDDGKTPFTPSHMVAANIIVGMAFYTIFYKWLNVEWLQDIITVMTAIFCSLTVLSAKKSKSAKK